MSGLDELVECAICGAAYSDTPPSRAAHRRVFDHQPRPKESQR